MPVTDNGDLKERGREVRRQSLHFAETEIQQFFTEFSFFPARCGLATFRLKYEYSPRLQEVGYHLMDSLTRLRKIIVLFFALLYLVLFSVTEFLIIRHHLISNDGKPLIYRSIIESNEI